jgi:hypothetical protein
MSPLDELELLNTWNNVGIFFLSQPFSFAIRKALKRDLNGSSVSFSIGDAGMFVLDFSKISDIKLITKNDYAKELASELRPTVSIPEMIGACLRVRLAEGITIFLFEERL